MSDYLNVSPVAPGRSGLWAWIRSHELAALITGVVVLVVVMVATLIFAGSPAGGSGGKISGEIVRCKTNSLGRTEWAADITNTMSASRVVTVKIRLEKGGVVVGEDWAVQDIAAGTTERVSGSVYVGEDVARCEGSYS
jgi:hypothetical protein